MCLFCIIFRSMLKNFQKKRLEEEKKHEESKNTDFKTAEQRMKIDLQEYDKNKIDNVEISFPKENSVTDLIIKVIPNKERSFYRNSRITFSFHASQKYPHEAPEVRCLNKILHPNIDTNGKVCLSILREGWKPIYELYQVTMGLLHLLENIKAADIEKPLDVDAANLMNKDINEFDTTVQETIKGKSFFGRQFDNVYYVAKK